MVPVNSYPNIDPNVLEAAIQLVQNGQAKIVMHGEIQLLDGSSYKGDMLNNVPHGKGVLKYKQPNDRERVSYEGDFVEGKIQGHGIVIWTDGSSYAGQWHDDKLTGKGTKKYAEPGFISYEGNFVDGIRQGFGTMIWSDGDRYEGQWIEDNMTGKGTMKYAQPDEWKRISYEGNFVKGLRHGIGTLIWSDGGSYVGQWTNDMITGKGTKTYARTSTNASYEGDFVDGLLHGFGKMIEADGTIYEGEFKNDIADGQGTMTHKVIMATGNQYGATAGVSTRVKTGTFKNGQFYDGTSSHDGQVLYEYKKGKATSPNNCVIS